MSDRYMVIHPDTLEAMRRAGHVAKLEARIEKLEAALQRMLAKCTWEKQGQWCGSLDCHCRIARKALEGKDD